MGLFDRLAGRAGGKVEDETEAAPAAKACPHHNRQDVRTFGRGNSGPNRWRCVDCGYSPVQELNGK